MECFGTTDFDNKSRLITLYAIIISGLHCTYPILYTATQCTPRETEMKARNFVQWPLKSADSARQKYKDGRRNHLALRQDGVQWEAEIFTNKMNFNTK